MIRTAALALALVGGLLIAMWASSPPPPVAASAPATAFSSDRAFADIRFMGAEPHPIESVRHGVVRDYLIGRMQKLGLEVRVQKDQSVVERPVGGQTYALGAYVENLIGVLPGKDRTLKPLLIMAHYDGALGSPAAADDAAGTASGLEVVRALKAQGTPERDVVLLLSDGEEAGLLGARAFFADDPLAKQVGAVINMETRGSGGRTFMFETAKHNGAMVDLFRRTAVNPTSNSLAIFIYENMPNDTDFTVSKHLGVQGLNYAFIGRQFDYHSPTAIPENTEPGSVQHMGEQVLSAAQAMAFDKTLPQAAPDRVFADVFGLTVIAYSPAVGWLVLAVGIALAVFAVLRLKTAGEAFSPVDLARSDAAAFALFLFTAALFSLARSGTGVPHGFVEEFPLLARFNLFEAALGALGLGAVLLAVGGLTEGRRRLWALALPVVVGVLVWTFGHWAVGAGLAAAAAFLAFFAYGKPVSPLSAIAGFLAAGFGLAIIAQALAPTTAFLFAWPLALVSLGLAVSSFAGGLDRPAALAVNGVAAILGLGWLLAETHGVALGVGSALPQALSLFAWLCAIAAIPLLAATPRASLMGVAATVVGAALIGAIFLEKSTFTPRHPRATEVMYVHDADTGKYWRVSLMDQLDPWTEQVLKADGGKIEKRMMRPLSDKPVFAALAAPAGFFQRPADKPVVMQGIEPAFRMSGGPPEVRVIRDGDTTKMISLLLEDALWPKRQVLSLRTSSKATVSISDGRTDAVLKKGGTIVWSTPPDSGSVAEVKVETSGHGSVEIRYAEVLPLPDHWPKEKPLPPLPKEDMAWRLSGSTVEIGTIKQSW